MDTVSYRIVPEVILGFGKVFHVFCTDKFRGINREVWRLNPEGIWYASKQGANWAIEKDKDDRRVLTSAR